MCWKEHSISDTERLTAVLLWWPWLQIKKIKSPPNRILFSSYINPGFQPHYTCHHDSMILSLPTLLLHVLLLQVFYYDLYLSLLSSTKKKKKKKLGLPQKIPTDRIAKTTEMYLLTVWRLDNTSYGRFKTFLLAFRWPSSFLIWERAREISFSFYKATVIVRLGSHC
jgi:hypothetical protein